jgi:hypothetical protein
MFGTVLPRRTAAILLAVCLNLALVPCTMALEVVEEGHDCCPPELRLDPSECCEVDDASVDARSGLLKLDDNGDVDDESAPAYGSLAAAPMGFHFATTGPPEPPPRSVALHKLNCVYLD